MERLPLSALANRLLTVWSRFEEQSREFAYAHYQVRRTGKFFDLAHKSASDDSGVCKPPDLPNLFRR
jgi:hypothetical protein